MHPYLTRLGVHPTVQAFFAPHYCSDPDGNLVFDYTGETETYGLAFHRVPLTDHSWTAGADNSVVRRVIICSSAVEAIAWLNCNFSAFHSLDHLLFVATGNRITDQKLAWIRRRLPGRKYGLLFGNDLLGRICDLKAAAAICGYPVHILNTGATITVDFRYRHFELTHAAFSLNAFERISGFRFAVKTLKCKQHESWLNQLTTQSFKN